MDQSLANVSRWKGETGAPGGHGENMQTHPQETPSRQEQLVEHWPLSLKVEDDPHLTWQPHGTLLLRKDGALTPLMDPSESESSGIVPALVAAGLFITLLLALYTVLWKCMDSRIPKKKKSRSRRRAAQTDTV